MTDEELKAAEAWWMSVNIPPWARGEARKLFAHIRHLQAENERLESERAALCAVIGTCKAGRDGDCSWSQCPQTRDGGKHYQSYCPLARYWEAVWESQGYDIR